MATKDKTTGKHKFSAINAAAIVIAIVLLMLFSQGSQTVGDATANGKCIKGVCKDTTLPVVSITASPANPVAKQIITFKAVASDNVKVASITVYVDGISRTCKGTTVCSYEGPLPLGQHKYYATATDTSDNTARDPNGAGGKIIAVIYNTQTSKSG